MQMLDSLSYGLKQTLPVRFRHIPHNIICLLVLGDSHVGALCVSFTQVPRPNLALRGAVRYCHFLRSLGDSPAHPIDTKDALPN